MDPERESERGALSRHAFAGSVATVAPDDTVHDGQADPGAGKLLVGVQAFEWTEKLVRVLHVEARAVIANEEDALAAMRPGPHLDTGVHIETGELPRVTEK